MRERIHFLYSHLKSSINENNRPGIVHRLDKDTSGLIVIAKNNIAHLKLSNQFKDHSISRKYQAIVWGTPQNQKIELHPRNPDYPIIQINETDDFQINGIVLYSFREY